MATNNKPAKSVADKTTDKVANDSQNLTLESAIEALKAKDLEIDGFKNTLSEQSLALEAANNTIAEQSLALDNAKKDSEESATLIEGLKSDNNDLLAIKNSFAKIEQSKDAQIADLKDLLKQQHKSLKNQTSIAENGYKSFDLDGRTYKVLHGSNYKGKDFSVDDVITDDALQQELVRIGYGGFEVIEKGE